MYEKFINTTFLRKSEKEHLSQAFSANDYILKLIGENFLNLHANASLNLLMNGQVQLGENDKREIARYGLISGFDQNNKPKMIHQSYAEFFLAFYVLRILDSDNENDKKAVCNVLQTETFILKEKFLKTREFLNGLLKKYNKSPNIPGSNIIGKELMKKFQTCALKFQIERSNAKILVIQSIEENLIEIARMVLDNFPDLINEKEELMGDTLLHIAYWYKRDELIQWLIDKGANQEVKNKRRFIPKDYYHVMYSEEDISKIQKKENCNNEKANSVLIRLDKLIENEKRIVRRMVNTNINNTISEELKKQIELNCGYLELLLNSDGKSKEITIEINKKIYSELDGYYQILKEYDTNMTLDQNETINGFNLEEISTATKEIYKRINQKIFEIGSKLITQQKKTEIKEKISLITKKLNDLKEIDEKQLEKHMDQKNRIRDEIYKKMIESEASFDQICSEIRNPES